MNQVYVRYIVDDAETATRFYCDVLGFTEIMNPSPGFSLVEHGSLRLLLNASGGAGAGQALRDGSRPVPGGWNRIQLRVDDLDAKIDRIRQLGVAFRSQVVESMGGRHILLPDPSGNLIELFESSDGRRG